VRVLVTGSSGFLGRHVAVRLGRDGDFDVTGFDLEPSLDTTFRSVQGDIDDLDSIRRASRGTDVVVHLGGVGDVDLASARPGLAARANVVGTTHVAMAAAETGARIVYASTWEVYGTPISDPIDETHPCDPANIYAATKLGGEHVLRALERSDGVPVTILRLGTAYGTGMRPNSVFRRFTDAARAGLPLAVQGSGQQWRQFTHASDIARAVGLALPSQAGGATFNIAADECVTVLRLAELVSTHYGTTVAFGPERPGDPPSARISSAAAARTLGWRAEVEFESGLTDVLDDVDARHERAAGART